jgi:uncharacterized protein (DUF885 family)
MPPRFILERAQYQVDLFLKPTASQNVLVTSLDQRSAKLSDVPEAARAKAAIGARRASSRRRSARPTVRVQAFMAEIHPKTNDTAGISRLPGGLDAYQQALANFTSTTLTPRRSTRSACAKWRASKARWTATCGRSACGRLDRGAHEEARRQLPAEGRGRPAPERS